jgi:AcrR family transcriptional regulator
MSMATTITKKRKARRSPERIKAILIDAVGKALIDHGFASLKLNLIVKYSNVDKKTIYRHYHDFQDLLTEYISKNDYWLQMLTPLIDYTVIDFRGFLKELIVNLYFTIYTNEELLQILRWELVELSNRTKAVTQQREDLSKGLIKQYEDFFRGSGLDFNSFSSILISSIYYLILHKEHSTFCLLDINKEKDRIPKTLEIMIDMLFDKLEEYNYKKEVARKAKKEGIDDETIARITGLAIDQIKV